MVGELGKFAGNGSVKKGKKPVYWCGSGETALAEAGVEDSEHESPCIFLKFSFPDAAKALSSLKDRQVSIVIWTTTPWTLVANLAIALHPEYDYAAVLSKGEVLILAEALLKQSLEKFGITDHKIIEKFKGKKLEGLKAWHPFIDRDSLVILGEHVTLDAGTGAVHTAPGHGQEGYDAGLRSGLDIYAPVDNKGRFTKETGEFSGQHVFKANKAIIELLKAKGALMAEEKISNSYPHCWRGKTPVIFRASEQWFISMRTKDLLKKTVEAVQTVPWVPGWGKDRFMSMVENRPVLVISRQRAWGVPIVAFKGKACGELLLDESIIDHVADIVEKEGADVWFAKSPSA